jgi:hypothetical protein
MVTKSEKPNGIYESARQQMNQAEEAMMNAGECATDYVQEHPVSTVLTTFAIGMVAGTCLVAALMQSAAPKRTWRDDAYDWGSSMTDRVKRYVPDLHRS